jgi:hypothetical protein
MPDMRIVTAAGVASTAAHIDGKVSTQPLVHDLVGGPVVLVLAPEAIASGLHGSACRINGAPS